MTKTEIRVLLDHGVDALYIRNAILAGALTKEIDRTWRLMHQAKDEPVEDLVSAMMRAINDAGYLT